MRRFTSEYLETTRAGMWDDSRAALEALDLERRDRVLDVGAGTGTLTTVLRAETDAAVLGLDVDPALLTAVPGPRLLAEATQLPVRTNAVDLVACQALLVNLPEPGAAVREFERVSSDLVAAVEPDNSAVAVTSTVSAESRLARRARERYLEGVETDPALGGARDLFEAAGLEAISVRRYEHTRTVEGPYSEAAVESARQKATGEGLERDREVILAGPTTVAEFDELRQAWREMGRTVVDQMQNGEYRRQETVPFFVTVGRVAY
jgi:ubiquinone/menaquinone biosynthesis C-methylase UbiE